MSDLRSLTGLCKEDGCDDDPIFDCVRCGARMCGKHWRTRHKIKGQEWAVVCVECDTLIESTKEWVMFNPALVDALVEKWEWW